MGRLELLENWVRPIHENGERRSTNPLDDPNVTIIATDIKVEPNEDLLAVAKDLVAHLDENVRVIAAHQLKSRKINKPGLVKISFASVDEKIRVLRQKRNLSGIQGYVQCFCV